jgi:hypothetical protein
MDMIMSGMPGSTIFGNPGVVLQGSERNGAGSDFNAVKD